MEFPRAYSQASRYLNDMAGRFEAIIQFRGRTMLAKLHHKILFFRRPRQNFYVELIANGYSYGWVFADSGPITRVIAKREGQTIGVTSTFHSRPDVAAAYPNSKYAEQSGFNLYFTPFTVGPLSTVRIFAELGGTEFLIGEGLTADSSNVEQQIIAPSHTPRSSFPADVTSCSHLLHGDDRIDIERICELIRMRDLRGVRAISNYAKYIAECWSHFNFVLRFFPLINKFTATGQKDFLCIQNSPIEMLSIAHHLYVLKSYGVKGVFAEFGCYKGFSSSMLSYACHQLGIDMHIYDSFEGLPSSTSEYYKKGDFSVNLEELRRNIAQFGVIGSVVFHKGFFADSLKEQMPPPLMCLWMDVDLNSSAQDVMVAAKMLSPAGALFSHECKTNDFVGTTPCSERASGPDNVLPAILSYYRSEATTPNGFFVAGDTGCFWRAGEGIPVLRTEELQRLLQVIHI